MYEPIAGHDPRRYTIQFVRRPKDIEAWFAPIAGTDVLAPFRISVPTWIGNACLKRTDWGGYANPHGCIRVFATAYEVNCNV
jgi:hypothetical protein